jgi:hypothetical protein
MIGCDPAPEIRILFRSMTPTASFYILDLALAGCYSSRMRIAALLLSSLLGPSLRNSRGDFRCAPVRPAGSAAAEAGGHDHASAGRPFPRATGLKPGFGGGMSAGLVPRALEPAYGSRVNLGVSLFVTLRPEAHRLP